MKKAKIVLRELNDMQKDQFAGMSIHREGEPSIPLWGYQLEITASGYRGWVKRVYAQELDGHYLLFDSIKIFGVSDTETEADSRMREELDKVKKRYEDDGFKVEFESLISD